MHRITSPEPLEVPEVADLDAVSRADLILLGVDHSGPSYEGRVFFNNEDPGVATPLTGEAGYAGSFTVFGHGACYGEEGHCDPRSEYRDVFDLRPPHPLEPISRIVIVTDALKRLTEERLVVTVIAVDQRGEEAQVSNALTFGEMRLLIYEP